MGLELTSEAAVLRIARKDLVTQSTCSQTSLRQSWPFSNAHCEEKWLGSGPRRKFKSWDTLVVGWFGWIPTRRSCRPPSQGRSFCVLWIQPRTFMRDSDLRHVYPRAAGRSHAPSGCCASTSRPGQSAWSTRRHVAVPRCTRTSASDDQPPTAAM